MKTCQSCGVKMPIEANFCPICGAPQNEEHQEDINPGIYDAVNIRELKIQCGYGYETLSVVMGEVTINPFGMVFESNTSGVTGIMSLIATLGQKTRMEIQLKDITHMSIVEKGHYLCISTSDGSNHFFSGPHTFSFSENKSCVIKIGCILELYRRMYWYYGEYVEGHLSCRQSIGYHTDAVMRFDTIEDQELINFFEKI